MLTRTTLRLWTAAQSQALSPRYLSSTSPLSAIHKECRVRIVDNSSLGKQAMLEGKPPKVIHIYKKGGNGRPMGLMGDKIMVAIKGLKKRGYLIGCTQRQPALQPKFDSNNAVLIDDQGNPLGTRIIAPVPHKLRGKPELAKIIAIATKFV